jgi:hypothetical protein
MGPTQTGVPPKEGYKGFKYSKGGKEKKHVARSDHRCYRATVGQLFTGVMYLSHTESNNLF